MASLQKAVYCTTFSHGGDKSASDGFIGLSGANDSSIYSFILIQTNKPVPNHDGTVNILLKDFLSIETE